MKKTIKSVNISLIIELIICLLGVGIGAFGIWYDSAVVICICVIILSALCAAMLLLTQYTKIEFLEDEIRIVYLLGTLGCEYTRLGEIGTSDLFSFRLPFMSYYRLPALPLLSGNRYSFMESEILINRKNKYALLSHGVQILDRLDDCAGCSADIPAEIRKAEHRQRDLYLKTAKDLAEASPSFGYVIYGMFLKVRPTGSYSYVVKVGDSVTPLLSVHKCGRKYRTKTLFSKN